MNQLVFVIFFLYIRSFELPKYFDKFNNEEREFKPNDEEFQKEDLRKKQQNKVLENLHRVEANYFLERRIFW